MKIENLVFSLIIVFVAIVLLAITGWGISFMWGIDVTNNDGSPITDLQFFGLRVYLGLVLIGFVTGVHKLWDLFYFCMTQAPTGK